jgi:predicted LPLAT superfamily acyltransferase
MAGKCMADDVARPFDDECPHGELRRMGCWWGWSVSGMEEACALGVVSYYKQTMNTGSSGVDGASARVVEPASWDARSHGGRFGHWFFLQLVTWLGPWAAYAFIYPVAFFYLLAAGKERRASQQYLERVLGPTHLLGRWLRSYWHLLEFARCYLEGAMLGAVGPGEFEIEHLGSANIRALGASAQGGVILTAHLGTWELSSGLLKDEHGLARVSLVMFRSDAEQLQRYVESLHGKRPRVIAVGEGDLAALDIMRAVRSGEVVAMQGDRTVDARDLKVPFFGRDARWPVGPWVIAALSGAPLLWSFAIRVGPRRYKFIADAPRTVRFEPGRPRDEQLRGWIGAYVASVEEVLRAHPYMWFNFFDFWAAEPKLPAVRPGGPGPASPARGPG